MSGIGKWESLVRSSLMEFDGIFLIESRMSSIKVDSQSSPDMALMYNSDHGVFALELELDWTLKISSTA